MKLEDGGFLMSPHRYDDLIKQGKYTVEQLNKLNIIRVDPRFRVIALGLPVPRYPGNALDPSLRSRFQGRYIQCPTIETQYQLIKSYVPQLDNNLVEGILSFAESIR